MVEPAPRIHYPPALQDALAWLAAPPAADPLHDLSPMRRHLAAVARLGIPALQHVKILELFEARARLASRAVKPLLLDATLPVPKRLRVVAQGLMRIHRAIAAGYLRALREAAPGKLKARTRSPGRVCAAGLANLLQEYEIGQFVAATPAQEFWVRAQAFHAIATAQRESDVQDDTDDAIHRMKT
ncbi:MAG: hypothetical protein ACM3Y9_15580, partial [Ignavibacteria bacterium]